MRARNLCDAPKMLSLSMPKIRGFLSPMEITLEEWQALFLNKILFQVAVASLCGSTQD